MKKRLLTAACICLCLFGTAVPTSAAKKTALSAKKITLTVGSKKKLKIKNSIKKVTWKSMNKKVASVTSKGIVKAKKIGKTVVKAKAAGKTYRCTVIVKRSSKPNNVVIAKDTEEGWGPIVP